MFISFWWSQIKLLVLHVLSNVFAMHWAVHTFPYLVHINIMILFSLSVEYSTLEKKCAVTPLMFSYSKAKKACLWCYVTLRRDMFFHSTGNSWPPFDHLHTNLGCCVTFYSNDALSSRFSNLDWIIFSNWRVTFNLYEKQL